MQLRERKLWIKEERSCHQFGSILDILNPESDCCCLETMQGRRTVAKSGYKNLIHVLKTHYIIITNR